MKKKSIFLLMVFLLSLLPHFSVQADEEINHPLDNAISLMYISDAILTDESEIDDSSALPGLFSPALNNLGASPGDELLARMIHAVKMERNDLDANCRLLKAMYNQADQECEVEKIQSWCAERRLNLNSRIGQLHKIRGDRRKWGTIIWHSVKRGSSNFWHRIGPLGRRFLSRLGPEVLQMVASGGLSGNVLKELLKQTAKSMGREHIRQVVLQGVGHLLQRQISIARAAGVDICDPDEEKDTDQAGEAMESSESIDDLEFAFQWTCSSDIGPYGAWMQDGDPNTIIDKSELIFNLQAGATEVNYDFTFSGIVQLPQYSAEGNLYDHQKADHKSSGKGSSTWDGLYFFGSVTIDRTEHLYSLSDTSEYSEFNDSYDKSVIGALSPKDNEIHLCFHTHTEEQFDSIKQEPYENLLGHCTSSQYFVCTPKE
jgi:hypothetical protein